MFQLRLRPYNYVANGIVLLSHEYSAMHIIQEAAAWRHWLINVWTESLDASIIAETGRKRKSWNQWRERIPQTDCVSSQLSPQSSIPSHSHGGMRHMLDAGHDTCRDWHVTSASSSARHNTSASHLHSCHVDSKPTSIVLHFYSILNALYGIT